VSRRCGHTWSGKDPGIQDERRTTQQETRNNRN